MPRVTRVAVKGTRHFAPMRSALRTWHAACIGQAPCEAACPVDLPAEVLNAEVLEYDVTQLPFAELAHEALGTDALDKLHETREGRIAQEQVPRSPCTFRARWMAYFHNNAEARQRLDATLRHFVQTFVTAALGGRWEQFIYQAEPSLRVHLPHAKPLGMTHCDADYFHQPAEVNFWIPLVPRVWGTNSLFAESAPGLGDFTPFEAAFGQCVRFYGNRCVHYCVTNVTDVTRVSLDVRVIPTPLYDPAWLSPKGIVPFFLGERLSRRARWRTMRALPMVLGFRRVVGRSNAGRETGPVELGRAKGTRTPRMTHWR